MVDINEAKENRKKLEKEWKSKQDQMQELNNLQVWHNLVFVCNNIKITGSTDVE